MNAAGPGRGLPTRPRWLSALLCSPGQRSLVRVGGASLCSVRSPENLIILRANAACPFPSVFTHKNLFLLIPIVAEPWRHSRVGALPRRVKGEQKVGWQRGRAVAGLPPLGPQSSGSRREDPCPANRLSERVQGGQTWPREAVHSVLKWD